MNRFVIYSQPLARISPTKHCVAIASWLPDNGLIHNRTSCSSYDYVIRLYRRARGHGQNSSMHNSVAIFHESLRESGAECVVRHILRFAARCDVQNAMITIGAVTHQVYTLYALVLPAWHCRIPVRAKIASFNMPKNNMQFSLIRVDGRACTRPEPSRGWLIRCRICTLIDDWQALLWYERWTLNASWCCAHSTSATRMQSYEVWWCDTDSIQTANTARVGSYNRLADWWTTIARAAALRRSRQPSSLSNRPSQYWYAQLSVRTRGAACWPPRREPNRRRHRCCFSCCSRARCYEWSLLSAGRNLRVGGLSMWHELVACNEYVLRRSFGACEKAGGLHEWLTDGVLTDWSATPAERRRSP
jgi:hypothetical protein